MKCQHKASLCFLPDHLLALKYVSILPIYLLWTTKTAQWPASKLISRSILRKLRIFTINSYEFADFHAQFFSEIPAQAVSVLSARGDDRNHFLVSFSHRTKHHSTKIRINRPDWSLKQAKRTEDNQKGAKKEHKRR